VFAVNVAGAPIIAVAPGVIHVVTRRVAVDIITYLAPSIDELAVGIVIAKLAPVEPVKYVFVLDIVAAINVGAEFINGTEFNAKRLCTLKFAVSPFAVPKTVSFILGATML
jgi:hypothetical protein